MFRRFACTITYIISIILVNNIFVYAPIISVYGWQLPPGDIVVGATYLLRDFVQREIKHYVILAMVAGCFFSYVLADKQVALASVSAFTVGEIIDWAIYTYTKKPLSQRLLWSSCLSAPVDSVIFLKLTDTLTSGGMVALMFGKLIGILALWYLWKVRSRQATLVLPA